MVEQITSYEVYKNLIKEAPIWNNGFASGMIKKYQLKKDTKRIVAIKADIERKQNKCIIEMESTHNDNINPEYQVEIPSDNGKTYEVISAWNESDKVSIDLLTEGEVYIMVKARIGATDNDVAFQTYSI